VDVELRLEQLADGMTAARVSVWLKREGEFVSGGEPIVEVETDKTTVEIEAPASGVLQAIRVKAGTDGVPVGTVLAIIGDHAPSTDRIDRDESGSDVAANETPARRQGRPDVVATPSHPASATPLAAKMAALAGIDLSALTPGGSRREITKADIDAAIVRSRPASTPSEMESRAPVAFPVFSRHPPAGTDATFEDRPLSPMRRASAARLQQSKQTIPHFYLQADCHVDALWSLRAQLNASRAGVEVTLTDLIVLATSRALLKTPAANATLVETSVRVYDSVDIAVAVNTLKGIVTPIVRDAQNKPLGAISRELADLVERARSGKLRPEEYTGGTFTISNLGMFGVTSITPIINPPQACILGVGRIEQRAVVVANALTVGRTMSCTLAADHRVVDGAAGAEYLKTLRQYLEQPVRLIL
jgi:pyruvate dehydrogenase E2 component (dihydrolipoamide acetyltransferase)